MVSKRFLLTLVTLLIIGVGATIAIFIAKGYRISPDKGTTIAGTGILSITSVPDQASIYLDGHLTTATNTNINSLPPKEYQVRIIKEGFIPWEKKVEVKEGLVSDVKATLFRSIPTVYPLTYSGVSNLLLSPDGQKLVYVVPGQDKKNGVWVWAMSDNSIAFARGAQPHQIALPGSLDWNKASFRWSPDSSQILASFPEQHLLLDENRLNDPPRDITAIVDPTLRSWDDDQKAKDLTRLELIKDLNLRRTASSAAVLKWSPDESKILYSTDGKTGFKVVELVPSSPTKKAGQVYNLPDNKKYSWLSDSLHLYFIDSQEAPKSPLTSPKTSPKPAASVTTNPEQLISGKISVLEYDGGNVSEIYAGLFDPQSVFAWPDGSRLVLISSVNTATASQPNLFGINLK